jgi:hypothetical protein
MARAGVRWAPSASPEDVGFDTERFSRSGRVYGCRARLAVDSGITSHAVAAALGHESFKTTAESYAQRDAVAGAQQRRVLGVLAGGKIALLSPPLIGGNHSPIVP